MTPSERADLLERIRANAEHNRRDRGALTFGYGLMVCTCPDTDADPAVDFGMCHGCARKPLALFGAAS